MINDGKDDFYMFSKISINSTVVGYSCIKAVTEVGNLSI